MRRLITLPLLPLVLALGCDPAEEACEPPAAAFRGIWENGTSAQGSSMQGVYLQGIWENGIWENGLRMQGLDLAGIRLETDSPRGAIGLRGTELVAAADDATPLRPDALVGAAIPARLSDGSILELSIAEAFVEDDLHLYALTIDGVNVCGPDGRGLFVRGVWNGSGDRDDALAEAPAYDVTYSCMDGVIAKCVTWGYRPWDLGPEIHQACTRMARADYCGDGVPHTRNGTEIDIHDDLGVQAPTPDRPDLDFEAGWGPDGAICVSHPRWRETVVGEGERLPSCWEDKPACDTPDAARELGATLFNASAEQPVTICADG